MDRSTEGPESKSRWGQEFFSFPHRPDRLWVPLSLLYNGYREPLFPGVIRQGPEADYTPPTGVDLQ
jgi:hypothetical protein